MIRAVQGLRSATVRWRVPLTLAGAALFIIGLGLSITALDVTLDRLAIWPVVAILMFLAPLTLALAAVSLQQLAQAVGSRIGFREAFAVSAIGRITEILPLPGGAIVRGAALMRAGAGLGESTWIVTLTGGLTVSMAVLLAGLPLVVAGFGIGYVVLLAGAAGTLVSAGWIARRAGVRLTLSMIAVRVGAILIGIARVSAAFSAIGASLEPIQAALFVVCGVLGTAVTVVPAGVGVSESIAAALAILIDMPPAAAFLAIAINRVAGIATSGVFALLLGPRLLKSAVHH